MKKRILMVIMLLVTTLTAVNGQELRKTNKVIASKGCYLYSEKTYEGDVFVKEEYSLQALNYPFESGWSVFRRGTMQEIYETILEIVDFESKYIDEEGVAKDMGEYKLFSGDHIITIWNGKQFVVLKKGRAMAMKTKLEKYCEEQGIKLERHN